MIHINRFMDRLQTAEGRNARDLSMSIREARDLHTDITRLLTTLQELQDQSRQQQPARDAEDIIRIDVSGGNF